MTDGRTDPAKSSANVIDLVNVVDVIDLVGDSDSSDVENSSTDDARKNKNARPVPTNRKRKKNCIHGKTKRKRKVCPRQDETRSLSYHNKNLRLLPTGTTYYIR